MCSISWLSDYRGSYPNNFIKLKYILTNGTPAYFYEQYMPYDFMFTVLLKSPPGGDNLVSRHQLVKILQPSSVTEARPWLAEHL